MEEARTISALSPVARMDRPSRVVRNSRSASAAIRVMNTATASLYQLPITGSSTSLARVKMVVHLNRFRLLVKPMAIRLMVYRPVFTMMPARMLSTPRRVCRKAVTKPEHTPAAMAANNPRNGCPARATVEPTAQPRMKQLSVERSAMFSTL